MITIADLKDITRITSEFNLVYYYENGSFDIADHSYDEVADAVAKAKDVLEEDSTVKRVNIVYMATAWDVDGVTDTIIEEDIMEILR